MPSGSVTITGTGFHLSSGSGAMVSTASTAPVSSSRSARRVVMPVHCAPSRGGFIAARSMRRNGPKNSSSGRRIAGAAMHLQFHRRIVRLDELAGLAALLGDRSSRDTPQSVHSSRGAASASGGVQSGDGVWSDLPSACSCAALERADDVGGDPAAVEIARLRLHLFVADEAGVNP